MTDSERIAALEADLLVLTVGFADLMLHLQRRGATDRDWLENLLDVAELPSGTLSDQPEFVDPLAWDAARMRYARLLRLIVERTAL